MSPTACCGSVLAELKEPYGTMVLAAVRLGLRVSEIVGLHWGDFNWENQTVLVLRSVVHAGLAIPRRKYFP